MTLLHLCDVLQTRSLRNFLTSSNCRKHITYISGTEEAELRTRFRAWLEQCTYVANGAFNFMLAWTPFSSRKLLSTLKLQKFLFDHMISIWFSHESDANAKLFVMPRVCREALTWTTSFTVQLHGPCKYGNKMYKKVWWGELQPPPRSPPVSVLADGLGADIVWKGEDRFCSIPISISWPLLTFNRPTCCHYLYVSIVLSSYGADYFNWQITL